jgi:hypothetical protein
MNLKLIFLFTLYLFALGSVSAQNKQVLSARDSTLEARKTLQALILTLKKKDDELFAVFDSTSFKRILNNHKPVFEKFYSKHLKTYKITKGDALLDSTVQSVFLYNNIQYLKMLPDSIIQIREDTSGTQKGFQQQHALGKYCKAALNISIVVEEEEFAFYSVIFDGENKIFGIAPLIYFEETKPIPKITKALKPLLDWRDTSKTIYRLDIMRN